MIGKPFYQNIPKSPSQTQKEKFNVTDKVYWKLHNEIRFYIAEQIWIDFLPVQSSIRLYLKRASL